MSLNKPVEQNSILGFIFGSALAASLINRIFEEYCQNNIAATISIGVPTAIAAGRATHHALEKLCDNETDESRFYNWQNYVSTVLQCASIAWISSTLINLILGTNSVITWWVFNPVMMISYSLGLGGEILIHKRLKKICKPREEMVVTLFATLLAGGISLLVTHYLGDTNTNSEPLSSIASKISMPFLSLGLSQIGKLTKCFKEQDPSEEPRYSIVGDVACTFHCCNRN